MTFKFRYFNMLLKFISLFGHGSILLWIKYLPKGILPLLLYCWILYLDTVHAYAVFLSFFQSNSVMPYFVLSLRKLLVTFPLEYGLAWVQLANITLFIPLCFVDIAPLTVAMGNTPEYSSLMHGIYFLPRWLNNSLFIQ